MRDMVSESEWCCSTNLLPGLRLTFACLQFHSAPSFNQDLPWNTHKVTDMSSMFLAADAFNGDVSAWNTSSVQSMASMFKFASSFQGRFSLLTWDTSSVTNMSDMFFAAILFKGDGLASWNVNKVADMTSMVSSRRCG
jgi:surface protein